MQSLRTILGTSFELSYADAAFLVTLALGVMLAFNAALARSRKTAQTRAAKPAEKPDPSTLTFASTKRELGLASWPNGLFSVIAGTWLLILVSLTLALLTMIWFIPTVAFEARTGTDETRTVFRFTVIAMAALSATIGAVIAVPLTLYRAELTRRQTDNAERSHFNDKINAATEGLHAMRQVSKKGNKANGFKWETLWEADITRRNAAIDALHGLAEERPAETARIARMLSVYVRLLSTEYPAEVPPPETDTSVMNKWATELSVKRPDMELAVQTLGRLRQIKGAIVTVDDIDLTGANLQAMNLKKLNFESANLSFASMQACVANESRFNGATMHRTNLFSASLVACEFRHTNLARAVFYRVQAPRTVFAEANLKGADLRSINLNEANLSGTDFSQANLSGASLGYAYAPKATFISANLAKTDLDKARLQASDFSYCNFSDQNFYLADFTGANLARTHSLETADLRGTRLGGAAIEKGVVALIDNSLSGHKDIFAADKGVNDHSLRRAWRAFQDTLEDFPEEWKVRAPD